MAAGYLPHSGRPYSFATLFHNSCARYSIYKYIIYQFSKFVKGF